MAALMCVRGDIGAPRGLGVPEVLAFPGGRTTKGSNQVPGPSAKPTPPMDMAETLTPHRNPSGTTGVTPTSASV